MTNAPNKQGESRVIAQVGTRPHLVTVTTRDIRGKRTVVVEWREHGARRQWKATATVRRQAEAEARAYAKAKNAALVERARRRALDDDAPPAPLTWAELRRAYITAEEQDWAPNTLRNVSARLKLFSSFFGDTTAAYLATMETVDEFRAHLRRLEHEPAEIGRIVTSVKAVFAFGVRRELLHSRVPLYVTKKVKGHQRRVIPEFTPADVLAILTELKPRGVVKQNEPQRPWRPWAICLLAAQCGKRTKSQILPLRWDEITWSRGAAVVHWLAERDKTRKAHVQPLPRRSAALLRIVRALLAAEGYTGPLVFPAMPTERVKVKGRPYSYAALHHHLAAACARAEVDRAYGQALHAFRRYAVNEVLARSSGNLKMAGAWANDVDLRVLSRSYVRERVGEQDAIAALMPKPDRAQKPSAPRATTGGTTVQDRRAGSNHQATNSEPTANAPAQAEASEDVTV